MKCRTCVLLNYIFISEIISVHSTDAILFMENNAVNAANARGLLPLEPDINQAAAAIIEGPPQGRARRARLALALNIVLPAPLIVNPAPIENRNVSHPSDGG